MSLAGKREFDLSFVAPVAVSLSFVAFLYCLRQQELLQYGDAVAHINIARRVFDSQTPGPLQLGTVWLPLPHLLMMPFLISRSMWQTGMGGSVPSLFAYVLGVCGIFRLLRTLLVGDHWPARFAGWLGAAVFALNPNLLYLQSTAMTEPLYLALFIWAVVFFSGAVVRCREGDRDGATSCLGKAGLCLAGACLTRYDGWVLAAVMVTIGLTLAWLGKFIALRRGVSWLLLISLVAPLLWFGYNALVYDNPFEFANGPYSPKAIEERTRVPGTPPHPGTNDLPVAFRYFFKSAELNLSTTWLQAFWVASLALGTAIVVLLRRKLWPMLLLWTPVPFYMLSIAYNGVPIFLPIWWPFSYYNVRYGIEMLPAFAAFTGVAAHGCIRFLPPGKWKAVAGAVFMAGLALSYTQVLKQGPISFEEAVVNGRSRIALETQLAFSFTQLPSTSTYLMYLGDHVGALERAGIRLAQVIHEGNHRPWKRPFDPEGLWERALSHPAGYVDYVVEVGNDPVAEKVDKRELMTLEVIHVNGQPRAIISRTLRGNQAR
ncbi:MAG: hypothetical protein JO356_06650 [Acidobacteria bacterium]|nr:hypothetical protein [Acidobacteriota bacterium]